MTADAGNTEQNGSPPLYILNTALPETRVKATLAGGCAGLDSCRLRKPFAIKKAKDVCGHRNRAGKGVGN